MNATASQTTPAKPKADWLLPREHGAYVQLLGPLLGGVWFARGRPAALALGIAALAAFLAHEPLLVHLGQRGKRAKATAGRRALRQALVLAATAALLGAAGLAHADARTWAVAGAALVLTALLEPFVVARKEKTLIGTLVAATALSSAALPVALAGGASAEQAYGSFGVWSVSFALATWAVHAIKARTLSRGKSRWAGWLAAAGSLGVLAAAGVLVRESVLPSWVAWALVPGCLCAAALAPAPVTPRRMKAVGFTLAASSLATLAVMVAAGPG